MTSPQLPIQPALEAYKSDSEVQRHAAHNHRHWRLVHGGLELARANRVQFDPRLDYWYHTDRRVVVAYLDHRFRKRYRPASALRSLAFRLLQHFDVARRAGRLGATVLAAEDNFERQLAAIRAVAGELPTFEEFALLREVWGSKVGGGDEFKENFISYLDEEVAQAATPDDF